MAQVGPAHIFRRGSQEAAAPTHMVVSVWPSSAEPRNVQTVGCLVAAQVIPDWPMDACDSQHAEDADTFREEAKSRTQEGLERLLAAKATEGGREAQARSSPGHLTLGCNGAEEEQGCPCVFGQPIVRGRDEFGPLLAT